MVRLSKKVLLVEDYTRRFQCGHVVGSWAAGVVATLPIDLANALILDGRAVDPDAQPKEAPPEAHVNQPEFPKAMEG